MRWTWQQWGTGQTSDEFATTVCVKDSSGPYDFELSRRLIELARTNGIDCRVDIYPDYASDVSQALRAGWDVRGGLVGPGVDASHSFERLHRTSLEETARLLLAYLADAGVTQRPIELRSWRTAISFVVAAVAVALLLGGTFLVASPSAAGMQESGKVTSQSVGLQSLPRRSRTIRSTAIRPRQRPMPVTPSTVTRSTAARRRRPLAHQLTRRNLRLCAALGPRMSPRRLAIYDDDPRTCGNRSRCGRDLALARSGSGEAPARGALAGPGNEAGRDRGIRTIAAVAGRRSG